MSENFIIENKNIENEVPVIENLLLSVKDLVVSILQAEKWSMLNSVSLKLIRVRPGPCRRDRCRQDDHSEIDSSNPSDPPAKVKGGEIILEGENLFELPE